jgi:hypothetical protein
MRERIAAGIDRITKGVKVSNKRIRLRWDARRVNRKCTPALIRRVRLSQAFRLSVSPLPDPLSSPLGKDPGDVGSGVVPGALQRVEKASETRKRRK